MSTFSIRNQTNAMTSVQQGTTPTGNLFVNNSGGRGNLFMQSRPANTPRPPPTQADRITVQGQLAKYPQHPVTEAGRRAHQAQQAEWMRIHGPGTHITESMPYPLRPGTSPINSGECFTCGYTGHMGKRDGSNCEGRRALHPNEQAWRAICSQILRETRGAVNFQLVMVDDYGTVWQDIQGNEEGLSV